MTFECAECGCRDLVKVDDQLKSKPSIAVWAGRSYHWGPGTFAVEVGICKRRKVLPGAANLYRFNVTMIWPSPDHPRVQRQAAPDPTHDSRTWTGRASDNHEIMERESLWRFLPQIKYLIQPAWRHP